MTSFMAAAARLWRSPWLKPLNDVEALDDFLGLLHPMWSLTRIRARVRRVVQETADVRTFWLEPSRRWSGFAAGQHVVVELEINGVRHHRSFSLSSAPAGGPWLALTVKRAGRVTGWMHDHLAPGAVLTLSPAAGDFVLPASLPERLLLVSAGSGITPVMSLLRELAARNYRGSIGFVHTCRSPDEQIFGRALRELALTLHDLQLHLHYSAEAGRLTPQRIAEQVPDHAGRELYLCGPREFMDAIAADWAARGLGARVHREFFGAPPAPAVAGAPVRVQAARSSREFAGGGAALLAEAEAAGLAPKHGCRIGICQSCKCVKRSGTVQNLLTGQVSAEPGEWIQLCISAARSDVVLEI